MNSEPWKDRTSVSVAVTLRARAAEGFFVQESGWRSAAPGRYVN